MRMRMRMASGGWLANLLSLAFRQCDVLLFEFFVQPCQQCICRLSLSSINIELRQAQGDLKISAAAEKAAHAGLGRL